MTERHGIQNKETALTTVALSTVLTGITLYLTWFKPVLGLKIVSTLLIISIHIAVSTYARRKING